MRFFAALWALSFALLVAAHASLLSLPFFWDELGQFIPASLDILRTGDWVPRMTTPNVHPPGVMAYLALVWRVFGFSIVATRVAQLAVAAAGVAAVFLLAKRLGASGWWAAGLLLVTPLFYTQSMMAQLDMPAMALTAVALVLFLDGRFAWCAACSTLLVLTKETSVVAPAVFGAWMLYKGRRREATYFVIPMIALGAWLLVLGAATGNVLGDSQFAQYNVSYALHPVRAAFAILRRFFYLFFADFRWIGSIALALLWRRRALSPAWTLCLVFGGLQVLAVTLLGGAALERYLLPVFPILCAGFALIPSVWIRAALAGGLLLNLFWAPPYPFPFENNLAIVDFVRLQQDTAAYVESNTPNQRVASAWPFTDALRRPEFGYVSRPITAVESRDFGVSTFDTKEAGVVVVYTRVASGGLLPVLAPVMRRYYGYDEAVSESDLAQRGFRRVTEFRRGEQTAEVYLRASDLRP